MEIHDRTITFGSCSYTFSLPILKALRFGSVYVVLLRCAQPHDDDRNIYAISENCELVWRVKEDARGVDYTGIWAKDGELHASSFWESEAIIDLRDGSVRWTGNRVS